MGVVSWNIPMFAAQNSFLLSSGDPSGRNLCDVSQHPLLPEFAHTLAYHWGELQDNSEISELAASDGQGPHSF